MENHIKSCNYFVNIERQQGHRGAVQWAACIGGGLAAATRSGLPGRGAAGRWQGVEECMRL